MRAIWKGAVAFGLVNVPVRLYAATGEHEVPLHQVHRADGGRIRYRKTCSACGEPVEMGDIAKGYETGDGRLVVLSDDDLASLPLATTREIEVLEFVPGEQVDPILLSKMYYLEPDAAAAKPYALLREALAASDRMAVVKVALRQRESMAVLRVRGDVICLQALLWPDEVREPAFPVLDTEVKIRPQELEMASSLVSSLAGDFDPSGFEDAYQSSLESLISERVAAGATQGGPSEADADEGTGEVVDLLAALQRSVEKARAARGEGGEGAASDSSPTAKASGTTSRTSKASASKASGARASGTKATASSASTGKTSAVRAAKTAAAEAEDSTAASATSSSERAPAKARTSRRRAS